MTRESVKISNPEALKKKIKKFTKDNFHIVADFDSTLTKAFVDGESIPSSYALVREGVYLSPEYHTKANALKDYYHPIETSFIISSREKCKKMVEWWSKLLNFLFQSFRIAYFYRFSLVIIINKKC